MKGYWRDEDEKFFVPIKANPVIIPGFEDMDLCADIQGGWCYITEGMTGMKIGDGETIHEAIFNALAELKRYEDYIGAVVLDTIEKYGMTPRYMNEFGLTLWDISKSEDEEGLSGHRKTHDVVISDNTPCTSWTTCLYFGDDGEDRYMRVRCVKIKEDKND